MTIVPAPSPPCPCSQGSSGKSALRRDRVFAGGLPVWHAPPLPDRRGTRRFDLLQQTPDLPPRVGAELVEIAVPVVRQRGVGAETVVDPVGLDDFVDLGRVETCLRKATVSSRHRSAAVLVSFSDCRHLALLRMPAWSECRRILANDMHALDASPYLAISTIDAVGAERERERERERESFLKNRSETRHDHPSSPDCLSRIARHALWLRAADLVSINRSDCVWVDGA
jgi:hypothetical protein